MPRARRLGAKEQKKFTVTHAADRQVCNAYGLRHPGDEIVKPSSAIHRPGRENEILPAIEGPKARHIKRHGGWQDLKSLGQLSFHRERPTAFRTMEI
jgi:hypothetical protein